MEKIGFYAGSFAPITRGHLSIINEALNDYDKVIIGIGVNHSKPQAFSLKWRKQMINSSLEDLCWEHRYQDLLQLYGNTSTSGLDQISQKKEAISVVSYDDLTVDCALRSGATALIRGERIVGDHDAEMQNALLNRQILEVRKAHLSMATIPVQREELTYVSSSNAKALCGLGEYIVAQRYVTPSVHAVMMESYLKPTFVDLIQGAYLSVGMVETSYMQISVDYNANRHYHTLSHVAYMLNLLQIMKNLGHIKADDAQALKLAIFFHDYVMEKKEDDVAQSAAHVCNLFFNTQLASQVADLIMATEHLQTTSSMSNDMQIIHDLDFAILGDRNNYGLYALNLRREYAECSDEEYAKGRTDFLQNLLARPRLFVHDAFAKMFEKEARLNMSQELAYWQKH